MYIYIYISAMFAVMLFIIVISYCYQLLLSVIVISYCYQLLLSVIVISYCNQYARGALEYCIDFYLCYQEQNYVLYD